MHNLCKQNLSNAKVQLYYNVVVCINLVSPRDPGQLDLIFIHCRGHFTFWISLSLRLSLSPKFGLRPKISQKVKSFFRLVSAIS